MIIINQCYTKWINLNLNNKFRFLYGDVAYCNIFDRLDWRVQRMETKLNRKLFNHLKYSISIIAVPFVTLRFPSIPVAVELEVKPQSYPP